LAALKFNPDDRRSGGGHQCCLGSLRRFTFSHKGKSKDYSTNYPASHLKNKLADLNFKLSRQLKYFKLNSRTPRAGAAPAFRQRGGVSAPVAIAPCGSFRNHFP
jgi:hypothetical protein